MSLTTENYKELYKKATISWKKNKWLQKNETLDDFKQRCVIYAWRNADESRFFSINSFYYWVIHWTIKNLGKEVKNKVTYTQLDEMIEDTISINDNNTMLKYDMNRLIKKNLSSENYTILKLYMKGYTYDEISTIMHKSKTTITNKINSSIEKIRILMLSITEPLNK